MVFSITAIYDERRNCVRKQIGTYRFAGKVAGSFALFAAISGRKMQCPPYGAMLTPSGTTANSALATRSCILALG
jgi:hypothetical protein